MLCSVLFCYSFLSALRFSPLHLAFFALLRRPLSSTCFSYLFFLLLLCSHILYSLSPHLLYFSPSFTLPSSPFPPFLCSDLFFPLRSAPSPLFCSVLSSLICPATSTRLCSHLPSIRLSPSPPPLPPSATLLSPLGVPHTRPANAAHLIFLTGLLLFKELLLLCLFLLH